MYGVFVRLTGYKVLRVKMVTIDLFLPPKPKQVRFAVHHFQHQQEKGKKELNNHLVFSFCARTTTTTFVTLGIDISFDYFNQNILEMPAIQNSVEVEVARLPQHDVDDDEGSEALGLMTSEAVDRSRDEFDDEFYDSRVWSGSFRTLVLPMIVVLVIATLAVLLPGIGSASDTFESLRTPARIPVEYKCPSQVGLADNYDADFNKDYEDAATAITDNMTEFLETFRSKNFDTWGHSYDEVKEGMFHFKSTYYPPYLNDGDSIYESACGIGLNLFMTLEILQEAKGIENLFVYGNELVEVSANKANVVLDHVPAHGHKGVICTGDSADLQYIPENSFDLVYTGYIRYVRSDMKLISLENA